MTPEQAQAMYRRQIGQFETVVLRRYTGTGGGRTAANYTVRARVVEFDAAELVGGIVQGDRKLIVLAEDAVSESYPLPITKGPDSKVVVRGKELQIKSVDDNTRRIGGEVIAYDIVAGG